MEQRSLIPEFIPDWTRSERLEIYMKRKKITFTNIDVAIKVSRTSANRMLHGQHVSTYRHAQQLKVGIPDSLLPPARNIASGPKPKRKVSAEGTDPNSMEQAA